MLDYTDTIPSDPTNLNSCSWEFIRWASDEGIADLLWSVGDRKSVSVSAWGQTSSQYQINAGTFSCYILGFNHNADVEGNNRIHFEFGFTATSGGTHIAFAGEDYSLRWNNSPQYLYWPRMNPTNTNSGGWESCTMRTDTLNGSSRSFNLAVPSDLRNVVKTTTKYTDNVAGGAGSVSGNVTPTSDNFFLLNIVELFGFKNYINTYEANYTEQYQYYKNGNPKVRYGTNDVSTVVFTFLRSPRVDSATTFNGTATSNGLVGNLAAITCYAVSPAFCV